MQWFATGQRRADPGLDEQYALITEHYRTMLDHYGPFIGVNMARKHIGWYTKGLTGSAGFRNAVNQVADAAKVLDMLERFYSPRSEEHTSEIQSLMRNSYALFCLKKKKKNYPVLHNINTHIHK